MTVLSSEDKRNMALGEVVSNNLDPIVTALGLARDWWAERAADFAMHSDDSNSQMAQSASQSYHNLMLELETKAERLALSRFVPKGG